MFPEILCSAEPLESGPRSLLARSWLPALLTWAEPCFVCLAGAKAGAGVTSLVPLRPDWLLFNILQSEWKWTDLVRVAVWHGNHSLERGVKHKAQQQSDQRQNNNHRVRCGATFGTYFGVKVFRACGCVSDQSPFYFAVIVRECWLNVDLTRWPNRYRM